MIYKRNALRTISVLLSLFVVFLSLPLFGIDAGAASTAVKWDGRTAMTAGRIYAVTDSVGIRGDIVIPSGAKLSVRKGGELKIYKGASLKVYGELAVAIGGLIKNSGALYIKSGGEFNVYGNAQSTLNGTADIAGDMTIYNKGHFETSSAMKIYSSAYILNKGALSFYKSSDVKFSGNMLTTENSDLELRGIFTVTLGGALTAGGHVTVGAVANIKCSGRITLNKTATYTRFKTIIITKSGSFIDQRPEDEYQEMTVDILIDEPDVKLRGIDVSYAQGEIDWERVAASGVDFAIVRAARGYISDAKPMAEDDYFRRNIEEAQKYGIAVGVYFYSYASSVSEARQEAEFFVETIKDYQIQYPVILDMEEQYQGNIGKKKLTNMIDAFFEVLMENNYFPMFYSYKAWIEQYLDMTVLDKYAVWLAQVSDEVTYDGGYYIWQYSFTGKVSGIQTDVDLDISYKDWPTIFEKYGLNNM